MVSNPCYIKHPPGSTVRLYGFCIFAFIEYVLCTARRHKVQAVAIAGTSGRLLIVSKFLQEKAVEATKQRVTIHYMGRTDLIPGPCSYLLYCNIYIYCIIMNSHIYIGHGFKPLYQTPASEVDEQSDHCTSTVYLYYGQIDLNLEVCISNIMCTGQ
jgi:hypothetical protein